MIEEVTHYVKIVRSYAIVSLRFLMSLKVIHGKQLYNDRWVCMDSSGATRWCAVRQCMRVAGLMLLCVCLFVATRPHCMFVGRYRGCHMMLGCLLDSSFDHLTHFLNW